MAEPATGSPPPLPLPPPPLPAKVEEAIALVTRSLQQKTRPMITTTDSAVLTAKALRGVVMAKLPAGGQPTDSDRDQIVTAVRAVGRRIAAAATPGDKLVVENVARRVLRLIADEACKDTGLLRKGIQEAIVDFLDELEESTERIAEQALGHVHSSEVILTYGWSGSVQAFLKEAAKKRRFEVIVAENAPDCDGHGLAVDLARSEQLDVTVIPDAAIYAVMARVHKVIVGADAVMANGTLIAPAGLHLAATAAKEHAVPFVVCAGIIKLSPLFPHNKDEFNELLNPACILTYEENANIRPASVVNPAFDFIPSTFVTVLLTNLGGFPTSHVHRLISEQYDEIDLQL